MSTLEIKLFGTLSMERAGQPVTRFPSRRVKDLLAYLLLNRQHMHSREHLAGLFWSDCDADRARHCLNTALWRLQRVLGPLEPGEHPYLRVTPQHIGFNTSSDFRLDVAEFESRCAWAERVEAREQQAVLYRQAVACYQADLLTDSYEDWCLVERERLHCLYLRAQGRLFSYYSARGDYDAAAESARRILACDPLREEVHRGLIKVYLASGQPAAALRQYRACEEIVRRELGSELMPETQALLGRIMGATEPDGAALRAVGPGSPGPDLTLALARLQEAAGSFDRARIQLGEATTMVREVVQRLGGVATGASKGAGPTLSIAEQLRAAERQMSALARDLELPARASSG